jgi:putative ABC transport system substrate-binding protein
MGGKWLQLLRDVAPKVKQVTMLFNPNTAPGEYYEGAVAKAAKEMGIEARTVRVSDMSNIAAEIAAIRKVGGGLVVIPDTYTLAVRKQLVPLVNREKVPAICPVMPFVDDGGPHFVRRRLIRFAPARRCICRRHFQRGETSRPSGTVADKV